MMTEMTKYPPHQRYSHADFGKHRSYMLVLNISRVSITVDDEHEIHMESNFREADKPNAKEWLEEVAADISKAYGGNAGKLFNMLKDGL